MRRTSGLLLWVVLSVLLGGGAAAAQEDVPADTAPPAEGLPAHPAEDSIASPVVFPGDSVHLKIWKEPDLSGSFQVDENGVVTLPLLGPRPVANVPVEELRGRLLEDYGAQLKNPSIEVTIKRRVSVVGAVARAGLYSVDPTMQLGDVIAMAGGVSEQGNRDNIDVERGTQVVYEDLEMSSPVASSLRSGDRVVVGEKSWLSRNGKVVVGGAIAITGLAIRLLVK